LWNWKDAKIKDERGKSQRAKDWSASGLQQKKRKKFEVFFRVFTANHIERNFASFTRIPIAFIFPQRRSEEGRSHHNSLYQPSCPRAAR